MRVLVVHPAIARTRPLGADEQDRLTNIDDLARMGHSVHLITRTAPHLSIDESQAFYDARGISAAVYTHEYRRLRPSRVIDPAFLDGAAWEYADPGFTAFLRQAVESWAPDLVWCHATYLWAAARAARRAGVSTVMRSVNHEAAHFLHENPSVTGVGRRLRYYGKQLSEKRALEHSTVLAAITPYEQRLYREAGLSEHIHLLPLCALPGILEKPAIRIQHPKPGAPLRVVFMASTYNVTHNRAALDFVVRDLVPRVRQLASGRFEFHIAGSKIPKQVKEAASQGGVTFHDYVEDLDRYLEGMHIAAMPSLGGSGMQQKVFEVIARGLPTVTHERAVADYALMEGRDLLVAGDADDFASKLISLQDPALREQIAGSGRSKSEELFGRDRMDAYVQQILDAAREVSSSS
jgi:glycosyltransferase involved in cell wall biosynthesis